MSVRAGGFEEGVVGVLERAGFVVAVVEAVEVVEDVRVEVGEERLKARRTRSLSAIVFACLVVR